VRNFYRALLAKHACRNRDKILGQPKPGDRTARLLIHDGEAGHATWWCRPMRRRASANRLSELLGCSITRRIYARSPLAPVATSLNTLPAPCSVALPSERRGCARRLVVRGSRRAASIGLPKNAGTL
jgi:hypothetical protein